MAETKTILKLLVDTKSNKVLFAEAGKNFVDFLFLMLSLPLGTIVKLLSEKGMVGCLDDLHKSIEALSAIYLEPNLDIDSVLKPCTVANIPLLSLNHAPTDSEQVRSGGCVTGVLNYMVMDNLEVKPVSPVSAISVINKYSVKDVASLVEKEVQVGLNEGLELLKASLETKNVLTTVFLEKKAGI